MSAVVRSISTARRVYIAQRLAACARDLERAEATASNAKALLREVTEDSSSAFVEAGFAWGRALDAVVVAKGRLRAAARAAAEVSSAEAVDDDLEGRLAASLEQGL